MLIAGIKAIAKLGLMIVLKNEHILGIINFLPWKDLFPSKGIVVSKDKKAKGFEAIIVGLCQTAEEICPRYKDLLKNHTYIGVAIKIKRVLINSK